MASINDFLHGEYFWSTVFYEFSSFISGLPFSPFSLYLQALQGTSESNESLKFSFHIISLSESSFFDNSNPWKNFMRKKTFKKRFNDFSKKLFIDFWHLEKNCLEKVSFVGGNGGLLALLKKFSFVKNRFSSVLIRNIKFCLMLFIRNVRSN